jgi:hypothetical protein
LPNFGQFPTQTAEFDYPSLQNRRVVNRDRFTVASTIDIGYVSDIQDYFLPVLAEKLFDFGSKGARFLAEDNSAVEFHDSDITDFAGSELERH